MNAKIITKEDLQVAALVAAIAIVPQFGFLKFGLEGAAMWAARFTLIALVFSTYIMAMPTGFIARRWHDGISIPAFATYMLAYFPHDALGNDVKKLYIVLGASLLAMAFRAWMSYEINQLPAQIRSDLKREHQDSFKKKAETVHAATNNAAESDESEAIKYAAVPARHNFTAVQGNREFKAKLIEVSTEIRTGKGNGILFDGEPGNGKTFMAEALAGHLNLPFMNITYGDVVSKWVGETPQNVAKVFADARRQAPCVLFLDEIDSMIPSRDSASSGNGETNKITNVFLTELVSLRSSGVIIMAATNYIDRLDPAAIRDGRFDYKIQVPAPDFDARCWMLFNGVQKVNANVEVSREMIGRLATRWEGFSVARINAIVKEVGKRMVKEGLNKLTMDDFMVSLRAVQGRAGKLPENTPVLADMTIPGETKEALISLALRMQKIDEIERLGGSVPRGVLFYGAPGNGKTLMAKSLAKTSGWAFLSTSGNDLLHDNKLIDEILRQAADLRPCIVFIDEADDVLANRMGGNPAVTSLTNKLLAAMDGAKGRIPDVLFIAATNHPDQFDEAALRGGRFSEKIEFLSPGENEIGKFVADWMRGSKIPLAQDVSPAVVVAMLAGESNANVREILQAATNRAAARSVSEGKPTRLTLTDLAQAKATILGE